MDIGAGAERQIQQNPDHKQQRPCHEQQQRSRNQAGQPLVDRALLDLEGIAAGVHQHEQERGERAGAVRGGVGDSEGNLGQRGRPAQLRKDRHDNRGEDVPLRRGGGAEDVDDHHDDHEDDNQRQAGQVDSPA